MLIPSCPLLLHSRPLSRGLEYAPEVEWRCGEFLSAAEVRDSTAVRGICHFSWFGLDAWPRLATPRGHDATVGYLHVMIRRVRAIFADYRRPSA